MYVKDLESLLTQLTCPINLNKVILICWVCGQTAEWSINNPADTWRLYNVASTSMQRHDVASTLRRRCLNVMCPLGMKIMIRHHFLPCLICVYRLLRPVSLNNQGILSSNISLLRKVKKSYDILSLNTPEPNISYNITCSPGEDRFACTNQLILIRIYVVRLRTLLNSWLPTESHAKTLIWLLEYTGWSEYSLCAQAIQKEMLCPGLSTSSTQHFRTVWQ